MSTPVPEPAVADATRIVLRPVATPLPLGFLALAVGTTLVAGLQLDWVPATDGHAVALGLLAFVVPLQLIAALVAFIARDVGSATAMGILAGTWATIGLVRYTGLPGTTSDGLALFLLLAGLALLVPAAATATGKLVPTAVMVASSIRFALSAYAEGSADDAWAEIAGWWGVVLGALALYAALALALEDARRRTVLPVLRHDLGRASIEGPLADQVARLEGEAGVREQL
ncbi:MAG TPA: hypothetical protein VGO60_15160 [Iamia sp.]|nr:hypothetical protein [Iamia sp.]